MYLSEAKYYAVLNPTVYHWVYYVGENEIAAQIEHALAEGEGGNKVSTKIIFDIGVATFGGVCLLADYGLINHVQLMKLVDKIDDTIKHKDQTGFEKICDMYKNVNTIIKTADQGAEGFIKNFKDQATTIIGDALGTLDKKRFEKLVDKHVGKTEDENNAWFKEILNDYVKELCKLYIDENENVRFVSPQHLKEITERLAGNNERANEVVVAVGTPGEAYGWYKHKAMERRTRLHKLVATGDMIDVVVCNERRMWSDAAVLWAISAGVQKGKLDWEGATDIMKKFIELREQFTAASMDDLGARAMELQLFVEDKLNRFDETDYDVSDIRYEKDFKRRMEVLDNVMRKVMEGDDI